MSLKHTPGKYKVGLTIIREQKARTGAESWWLARGTSGSRDLLSQSLWCRNHKSAGVRRAQALVVCLVVLSCRLRKDPEIQHPLTAGRRHCQRVLLLVVIIIDVRLRHWTLLGADAVAVCMDHVWPRHTQLKVNRQTGILGCIIHRMHSVYDTMMRI